jgi:hypothetical protein
VPVTESNREWEKITQLYTELHNFYSSQNTRTVCEVCGPAAVRRCYAKCSGVIFVPLTVVRVWVTVVLKEPFLGWRNNYEGRLKSLWTHIIRKGHRHRTSTKHRLGVLWRGGDGVLFEWCESTNVSNGPRIIKLSKQKSTIWLGYVSCMEKRGKSEMHTKS